MKIIISLGLILLCSSIECDEPKKTDCHCKNCACTKDSHCGCFSEAGCKCTSADADRACACGINSDACEAIKSKK